MRKTYLLLLVGILFALPLYVQARHIIGGVITYECKGNGRYDFTMKMYRDDLCTNCADFDDIAYVGVYRCQSMNSCSQTQSNPYRTANVPLSTSRFVPAPSYPCLIPPNVRVEEGTYTFSLTLPLDTTQSYIISYQRCCRNETISNLVRPDNQGATFAIEITPAAQKVCNNTPIFKTFPPTIICNEQKLSYDHSATDADGDQLVYEFCSPLDGGGQLGLSNRDPAGSYGWCDGARPQPGCPPPYQNVVFNAPRYSPSKPMDGDPDLTIDPNTGLITGKPKFLGQYVVGVCVSEYRNGVLLSRVVRDFQFNVARCDPRVIADIEETKIITQKEYLVNSCGEFTINFLNQSYDRAFIKDHRWEFLINGQKQTYRDWSPTVTFPGVGKYSAQLMLNPGTECGDTANITVQLFPDIKADFSFAYDTCNAGKVAFTDLSKTGAERMVSWDWTYGNNKIGTLQNPIHEFKRPGDIPVKLKVIDSNECPDEITKTIRYFPVPSRFAVDPSDVNCIPATTFFDNQSFPLDSNYTIKWTFGDGAESNKLSPTHIYETPGTFDVTLSVVSPIGCKRDTIFPDLITVLPSPEAGFTYLPEQPTNLLPDIRLSDKSVNAAAILWNVNGNALNSSRFPLYSHRHSGAPVDTVVVEQIVIHLNGCRDTVVQTILVPSEVRFFIPNAFTPNGDSVNDVFRGDGITQGMQAFRMTIWNRWGEMIFEADQPDEAWNGRKQNVGAESPAGVYVVKVTYLDPKGETHEIKGFVALVR